MKFIVFTIVFLITLVTCSALLGCSSVPKTFDEAMEECMDDGKKSYECYGIVRGSK